jgi:hypothetical protein
MVGHFFYIDLHERKQLLCQVDLGRAVVGARKKRKLYLKILNEGKALYPNQS